MVKAKLKYITIEVLETVDKKMIIPGDLLKCQEVTNFILKSAPNNTGYVPDKIYCLEMKSGILYIGKITATTKDIIILNTDRNPIQITGILKIFEVVKLQRTI